jgi:F0F1-type ATP synthase alpha subunit
MIKADKYYSVEKQAPGVIERKSVSVPLETGIKAMEEIQPDLVLLGLWRLYDLNKH